MKLNFLNNRRFKHGSLATVITVGFIAAIVLINVVATLLLERFPLTIDLTKDNRFELTADSINYIKEIDQKVEIIVCADETAYERGDSLYKQAYEIIKGYAKQSGNISVRFVDLLKDPNFAKQYPTERFLQNDILIKTDLRSKKLASGDLFDIKQNQQTGEQTVASKAEQVMTSAIMYVTDKNPVTVSLLSGLDNVSVAGYKALLGANNYSVNEQNLLTEEINPDATFVILPQPATDLTAAEVKKLDAFLDNNSKFGKSLVFVASENIAVGPILKSFLAEWGVEIGDETIVETDPSHVIEQNPFTIINQIADADFASQLKSQQLPVVTVGARPVNVLFTEKDNRKTKVLTKTYDTAYLLPADADDKFDPAQAEHAEYNTMVIGSRMKYDGTTPQTSNLVAISSSTMISQELLNIPYFSNNDAAISMTNMIAAKKETVKILPVDVTMERILVTDGQIMAFQVVLGWVIPILVIITGLIIWLRRRHL